MSEFGLMHRVLRVASRVTGVSVKEIIGNRRYREHVITRAAIASICRANGRSLKQIGILLKKDHTTILHYTHELGHRPVVLEVARAIEASIGGAAKTIAPTRIQHATNPEAARTRVAPLPPGADSLVMSGVPVRRLREMYPYWRGLDD